MIFDRAATITNFPWLICRHWIVVISASVISRLSSYFTFLGAIRGARLFKVPWERYGRRRSGAVARERARSNLWNAPKTSKDVYQTSRVFAIRRGQGACKFPTVVCILKVLDSAQLRRWTSGTRFRGRDGGQCTTPAAPREERRGERRRREENRTRERGKSRRKAK